MASARSASWASTASTTPFRPSDDDQDLEVAPWDIRLGRGCSAARRKQSALSICDILEGSGAGTQVRDPGDVHLKLLDMLRSNWSSFDLHGRISMVLGTVNLLIGIAFYSLYYFRSSLGHFYVQPSGWMCFATFSVLTWWCVLFELSLSSVKHALVAIAILVGPACLLLLDIASEPGGTRGEGNYSRNGVENYPWVFSVVSGLAAFWEIGLCWSGVTWKGRWPMHWRCSFFINPLYMEAGPMQHQADVCTYPSVEEGAAGDAGLAFAAVESAAPLVACLDAVLQSAPIAEPQVATARRARDGLQEMCRAAGLPSERTRPVEAFWLVAPGRQGKTCWIDPDPIEGGAPAPDAPKVSLVELLDAAQKAMHALQQDAKIWTERDMERLATSGGDPVVNPCRFAAQFQTEGSAAKHPMGRKASLMYTGGCVLTSLLWAVVFVYSCYAYAQESAAAPAAI